MIWGSILMLLGLPLGSLLAVGAEPQGQDLDTDQDDTPEVETETTVDYTEDRKGLRVDGDLRTIFDYSDLEDRDGLSSSNDRFGFRGRIRADVGITDTVHLGARFAGRCFTGDCDPEFVFQSATPGSSGLRGGQVTFDQLYLHWFRTERGSFALGRLQTRFVLRGGVFAKSLDRNDSNNTNVTWTDGLQATYRAENGWNSSFILQRNARDGSGSIRRGQLDFDDSGARNTYFVGFENISGWGPIVQRGFDVSYLPASLLEDGDPNGRREDYWGFVGRLAVRWPQRSSGIRLRAGTEIGYAPEKPTPQALSLDTDVSGLAWDIVASIMDFQPGQSIGVNYARTGDGWFLSPQFRPNEELFEIHYQWRPREPLLVEARVRWREDLEQLVGTLQKREVFDMFLRLTWRFTVTGR